MRDGRTGPSKEVITEELRLGTQELKTFFKVKGSAWSAEETICMLFTFVRVLLSCSNFNLISTPGTIRRVTYFISHYPLFSHVIPRPGKTAAHRRPGRTGRFPAIAGWEMAISDGETGGRCERRSANPGGPSRRAMRAQGAPRARAGRRTMLALCTVRSGARWYCVERGRRTSLGPRAPRPPDHGLVSGKGDSTARRQERATLMGDASADEVLPTFRRVSPDAGHVSQRWQALFTSYPPPLRQPG